jgi:hypothetical protein
MMAERRRLATGCATTKPQGKEKKDESEDAKSYNTADKNVNDKKKNIPVSKTLKPNETDFSLILNYLQRGSIFMLLFLCPLFPARKPRESAVRIIASNKTKTKLKTEEKISGVTIYVLQGY